MKRDGVRFVRLTANAVFAGRPDSLGNAERLKHVELIRSGRPAYLLMCLAADPKADPRTIANFNGNEVFVGGLLVDLDGDAWIELAGRRPVAEARIATAAPHADSN